MAEGAVKSAQRALEILEVFARHKRPLALKEILMSLRRATFTVLSTVVAAASLVVPAHALEVDPDQREEERLHDDRARKGEGDDEAQDEDRRSAHGRSVR